MSNSGISIEFSKQNINRNFIAFSSELEKKWQESFSFIHAADPQFGLQERYVEQKVDYGWSKEIAWATQLVCDVNAMEPKPKFLVLCGDLVDSFPGDTDMRKQQEEDFKAIFSKCQIPIVCVCGNHDVGDVPDVECIDIYKQTFGDDYFSFWCGGTFFIVINSQYYKNCSQLPELAMEHDKWVQQQLEIVCKEKPQHAIVFQHIPYFVQDVNEPDSYFNIESERRLPLLDQLRNAGVQHVFCGHLHRNANASYKDLQVVVTSAVGAQLGNDVNGFRVVQVKETVVEHEYLPLGLN